MCHHTAALRVETRESKHLLNIHRTISLTQTQYFSHISHVTLLWNSRNINCLVLVKSAANAGTFTKHNLILATFNLLLNLNKSVVFWLIS